jgi:hypothetical protein
LEGLFVENLNDLGGMDLEEDRQRTNSCKEREGGRLTDSRHVAAIPLFGDELWSMDWDTDSRTMRRTKT